MLKQRLFWEPLSELEPAGGPIFACSSPIPFAAREDYKILLNDWPYGINPNITHLIVWSKVRIPDQKPEGYLTPESTALVEGFVKRVFIDKLTAGGVDIAKDKVLWFRNWTGLQSVRGLEHVHVLVRNAPEAVLADWMNSDKINASPPNTVDIGKG